MLRGGEARSNEGKASAIAQRTQDWLMSQRDSSETSTYSICIHRKCAVCMSLTKNCVSRPYALANENPQPTHVHSRRKRVILRLPRFRLPNSFANPSAPRRPRDPHDPRVGSLTLPSRLLAGASVLVVRDSARPAEEKRGIFGPDGGERSGSIGCLSDMVLVQLWQDY